MRPAVVCFSGKRKSGKDFICALLAKRLTSEGLEVAIRGVSYPLKEEYAMLNNLDAELLKSDATYKEIYRQKMVEWGENIRRKDPTYFCRAAIKNVDAVDVILISDCRRASDIDYFKNRFGNNLRLVRINSDVEVRKSRGWLFTSGVDDAETECALDCYDSWHFELDNSVNCTRETIPAALCDQMKRISEQIHQILID
uniref:Phosphomevalonate kinase n=1 Tax=Ascaris lumbricoides TaxID=6252 RepID=A0A0M3I3F7_ASCLU